MNVAPPSVLQACLPPGQQPTGRETRLDPTEQRLIDLREHERRNLQRRARPVRKQDLATLEIDRPYEKTRLFDFDLGSESAQANDELFVLRQILDRALEMLTQLSILDRSALMGESSIVMQDQPEWLERRRSR